MVAERLTESDNAEIVNAVTPDGLQVVFCAMVADRSDDLQMVPLEGDHATAVLLGTEFNERNAARRGG